MNDLITKASVLGGIKTVVGDGRSDILINSSGKIYLKTGNTTKILNDLIEQIRIFMQTPQAKNNMILCEDIKKIEYPGDGFFILDTKKKDLYITIDNEIRVVTKNCKPIKTDK